MKLGFIGQGWVGKNLADHYEDRGFQVVRYALEEPYAAHKDDIKHCDIVFIAVPTPTSKDGFDYSIVKETLSLVGNDKIGVIRSTVLPGTTQALQEFYPSIIVLHAPEFLTEATARHDVDNPERNIVGFVDEAGRRAAHHVLKLFPVAPFNKVVPAQVAELVKYAGNCFLHLKVVYANLLHDLAESVGADYDSVKQALGADERIGGSHLDIEHKNGRGAGGHCFIKDFAAFANFYAVMVRDKHGHCFLRSAELKNIELLKASQKDLDLLEAVYS